MSALAHVVLEEDTAGDLSQWCHICRSYGDHTASSPHPLLCRLGFHRWRDRFGEPRPSREFGGGLWTDWFACTRCHKKTRWWLG